MGLCYNYTKTHKVSGVYSVRVDRVSSLLAVGGLQWSTDLGSRTRVIVPSAASWTVKNIVSLFWWSYFVEATTEYRSDGIAYTTLESK